MKKAKLKTTKWDAVDYLKTDKDMADYLEAAIEDGGTAVIAAGLGDIAGARGMSLSQAHPVLPEQLKSYMLGG